MPTNVTWNGVTYAIPNAGELNWASLTTFLVALGTHAAVDEESKQTVRVATSTPVTVVAATDYAVVVDLSVAGPSAVTLPAGVAGQIFIIVDGKGDALTNNITITPNGAETIKGAANLVLDKNRQVAMLQYHAGTTDWKLTNYSIPIGGVSASDITGVVTPDKGGTGVANNAAATMTRVGNFDLQVTTTAATTVTMPTTGTLATLAGGELLQNKTLASPFVTGFESLQLQAETRYYDADGSNYVGFKSPAVVPANTIWDLPDADGTAGQVLATNGSKVLSFASVATSSLAEFSINVGDSADSAVQVNTTLLGNYKASSELLTFIDADVNTGTDTITITAHGMSSQDIIFLTNSGGALPGGLTADTDYYVVVTGANTFQLATSAFNAASGIIVDITSAAGGGTHTVHTGGISYKANDARVIPDADTTLTIADGFTFVAGNLSAPRFLTLPSTGVKSGAKYYFSNNSGVVLSFKSSDGTTMSVSTSQADPSIAVGFVIIQATSDTPTAPANWLVVDLYDEDQYSATTTGASTNGASVFLRREMNQVVARIAPAAEAAAAGGSLTLSSTNMPARFRPNTAVLVGSSQKRNGSNRFCFMAISTGGTIEIGESDFGFTGACFGVDSHISYILR